MDENGVIGRDNRLPWHLPADLAYFRQLTTGHTVVMGRKTFESIGKPLKNRRNVVVTRNPAFRADGCTVVHSLAEAWRAAGDGDVFVIGGAELFREALPAADRLYVTRIHHAFEGDVYFPEFPADEWRLVSRRPGVKDERNPYDHEFLVYERAKKGGESRCGETPM
jgi:dihydrofolate reductase